MSIIAILIFVWTILIGVFLWYHKMAVDCKSNPAIKCWKDWKCFDINKLKSLPSPLTVQNANNSADGPPPTITSGKQDVDYKTYESFLTDPENLQNMYTTDANGNYVLNSTFKTNTDNTQPPILIKNWDNTNLNLNYNAKKINGITCCVFNSDKTACASGQGIPTASPTGFCTPPGILSLQQ